MPAQAYAKKPLHQQSSKNEQLTYLPTTLEFMKLLIFLQCPRVIIKDVLQLLLFPPEGVVFLKNSSIFISGVEIDKEGRFQAGHYRKYQLLR